MAVVLDLITVTEQESPLSKLSVFDALNTFVVRTEVDIYNAEYCILCNSFFSVTLCQFI